MGNYGERHRWRHTLPFLVLLAAALVLSSQSYQQQTLLPWLSSDAVSEKLAGWLDGVRLEWNGREMSVESVGAEHLAEFILRKSAHLLLYAALSFTLLLSFWMLLPWRKWLSVAAAAGLVSYTNLTLPTVHSVVHFVAARLMKKKTSYIILWC